LVEGPTSPDLAVLEHGEQGAVRARPRHGLVAAVNEDEIEVPRLAGLAHVRHWVLRYRHGAAVDGGLAHLEGDLLGVAVYALQEPAAHAESDVARREAVGRDRPQHPIDRFLVVV